MGKKAWGVVEDESFSLPLFNGLKISFQCEATSLNAYRPQETVELFLLKNDIQV
jgi:hypothetical protein